VKRSFLEFMPAGTRLEGFTETDGEIHDRRLLGDFGVAPIVCGILRFVSGNTYAHSFGLQWNRGRHTQLDSRNGQHRSHHDFQAKTGIEPADWAGKRVLDADVLSLPFRPHSFDLIFSIGVLHHTPSAERATRALVRFLRPGGTHAVWLYATSPAPWGDPIDTAWRALTRRVPPEMLFRLARVAVPLGGALRVIQQLPRVGGMAVALYSSVLPKVSIDPDPEWRVLDTFDWWSPLYRSFHTYQQVEGWLHEEGLVDIQRLAIPVVVRGRMPMDVSWSPATP
jgi:SAM-dependent methyltransferase